MICRVFLVYRLPSAFAASGPDHEPRKRNIQQESLTLRQKTTTENSRLHFNYKYSERLVATVASFEFSKRVTDVTITRFSFGQDHWEKRSLNCLYFSKLVQSLEICLQFFYQKYKNKII